MNSNLIYIVSFTLSLVFAKSAEYNSFFSTGDISDEAERLSVEKRSHASNTLREVSANSEPVSMAIHFNKTIWGFPNVTNDCKTAWKKLLLSLTSNTDPVGRKQLTSKLLISPVVVKIFDSWAKLPERVLLGNVNFLGAYDECKQVPNMKYCSSSMRLLGNISGSYGSCFPEECTSDDVTLLLTMLNNYTKGIITFSESSTKSICEKPVDASTGLISTFFILCCLLALCVIGTFAEVLQNFHLTIPYRLRDDGNCDELYKNDDEQAEESVSDANAVSIDNMDSKGDELKQNISVELSPTRPQRSASINRSDIKNGGNCFSNFLACFSLLKNSRSILSTSVVEGSITSINGLRVISLTWVILGHVYIIGMTEGQPDNILDMLNVLHRFSFLAISNAYVSVDTFFVLSGLLVSYLTLRRITKKGMGCVDILMMYLHRFIRLTPSLGIVILFYTNILPIIIKAPRGVVRNARTEPCIDYWWTTMLYINNFYPTNVQNICLGWSWYLANDMQFYVVSPVIVMFMVLMEKLCNGRALFWNFSVILWLCALSMVTTGVITGVKDIPALVTSIFLPGNPRAKQAEMAFDDIYIKPYCRIPPYLIGLFLGYLFSRQITFGARFRRLFHFIGWSISIAVGLAVIYGPWHVYKENGSFFNDVENISYASFHRFAWGCAVAWVIYACHNKAGGLVNDLLSWKVWIPLSRLTYGAYLMHFIVLEFVIFVNEQPSHYQDSITIFNFISITVISYACAFILAVCVEYPVFNLEKKIFSR